MKNKILIFFHYNKNNELDDYVLYWLQNLKPIFSRVIFISGSDLSQNNKEELNVFCNKLIINENNKTDVIAWKDAILKESFENLEQFDSLTLMNDSCFGPLHNLNEYYEAMENKQVDFWSDKEKNGFFNKYFTVFNKNVVKSTVFQDFWNKIDNIKTSNKLEIILTKKLQNTGYIFKTWTENIKSPFIEINSILNHPNPKYFKSLISKSSNYPIELIDSYFTDIYNPNISLNICDKNYISEFNDDFETKNSKNKLKFAIHIHVYYLDVFKNKFIQILKNKPELDIFITTNTEDKKSKIIELFSNYSISIEIDNIYIFDNKGRDILPWLNISKELNKYDVVGHFHTKKTISSNLKIGNTNLGDSWLGDSWLDEITNSLLGDYNRINELFSNNDKLGILIPDVSYFYKMIDYKIDIWGANKSNFNKLWQKMQCKKTLDSTTLNCPIMPLGFMFWYRPQALKPLFDLKLNDNDFLSEPIPVDGTIAHVIERMPVYLAWNESFDYKIALNNNNITSGFDFKNNINFNDFTLKDILKNKIKVLLRFLLPNRHRVTAEKIHKKLS